MKQTDKGILINRISYGDSSFIITFYTLEKGIQKFIFQGVKKKKIPIFPLLVAEITYYKRPDSELGKLTNVDAKNQLLELSFHPIKSIISFFIADVLNKCLKHEEQDEELYYFLEKFILHLNEEEELAHLPVFFLTEFSKHLGVSPSMTSLEDALYFNVIDGEFSAIRPSGDIYYEAETARLIYCLFENDLKSNTFNKLDRKNALEAMIQYYQIHIPQFGNLTSLSIIYDILYA